MEFHEINIKSIPIIILELRYGIPRKGCEMNLNDASIKRITEICESQNTSICDACLKGGMSPSSIYDLSKGRTKCSKVITVKRFCEGVGMTLSEFFDREYFNTIEE